MNTGTLKMKHLIMNNDTIYEIATGEGHILSSILDKKCEYLSFLNLFGKGSFGYLYPRNINIHVARYFNQRLLNYTQWFSSNGDYIFNAQSVLQQMNFHNQIPIGMRNMSSVGLNASVFWNYKESVRWFVRNNQGYTFIHLWNK